MMKLIEKIHKKITQLLYKPVVVVAFHQVSETMDSRFETKDNWNSVADFIEAMETFRKRGYEFVSMEEAYRRIQSPKWRFKRSVAVSFDDAWRSILNVRTYLLDNKIPFTIFVNSGTWDACDSLTHDMYLTKEEIFSLYSDPLVSIGLHGHKHFNSLTVSGDTFIQDLEQNRTLLSSHPRYIPYYAYPFSAGNKVLDRVVRSFDLVPCYCNFELNYQDTGVLYRCGLGGFNIPQIKKLWL